MAEVTPEPWAGGVVEERPAIVVGVDGSDRSRRTLKRERAEPRP
jgi:hypothetical protein